MATSRDKLAKVMGERAAKPHENPHKTQPGGAGTSRRRKIVAFSLYPDELGFLDGLAEDLRKAGLMPKANRSHVFQMIVRRARKDLVGKRPTEVLEHLSDG